MSKASYPYPEDEFDVTGDPTAPRGVHRAPRSAWSRIWPFLVVLIVFPLLAYGVVTYLARDTSDDTVAPAPGSSASHEASTAKSKPSSGDASSAPKPTATAQQPVLSTPVSVLNASGISGLAGRQAQSLTGAGFTKVTSGNISSLAATVNTVFYKSKDLKSTAQLVADTLGISTITHSPTDAADGIAVVLRTDPDA